MASKAYQRFIKKASSKVKNKRLKKILNFDIVNRAFKMRQQNVKDKFNQFLNSNYVFKYVKCRN